MVRNHTIDKTLVSRKFAAAIPYYDKNAAPQYLIVQHLCDMLDRYHDYPLPGEFIFEVGCGTGLFTTHLSQFAQHTNKKLVCNDLCNEMDKVLEQKVATPYEFVAFDAENGEWPELCSIIASASCIQWWHEPLDFFTKAKEHLAPKGLLIFSTFGPDNLHELKEVTGSGLEYHTIDEIKERLEHEQFEQIELHEEWIPIEFDTFLTLLKHLKHTGVNGLESNNKLRTPDSINQLERLYRKLYPDTQKLTITYHAIYGTAIKSL